MKVIILTWLQKSLLISLKVRMVRIFPHFGRFWNWRFVKLVLIFKVWGQRKTSKRNDLIKQIAILERDQFYLESPELGPSCLKLGISYYFITTKGCKVQLLDQETDWLNKARRIPVTSSINQMTLLLKLKVSKVIITSIVKVY